jgi:hypothetical protein
LLFGFEEKNDLLEEDVIDPLVELQEAGVRAVEIEIVLS